MVRTTEAIMLKNDCGLGNRKVTGNFVIYFKNCSIEIKNEKFDAYEIENLEQPFLIPLGEFKMTRLANNTKIGEKKLHELHIQNLKKIDELKIQQLSNSKRSHVALVALIVMGIIAFIKYYGKTMTPMFPIIQVWKNRDDSSHGDGPVMSASGQMTSNANVVTYTHAYDEPPVITNNTFGV